MTELRLRDHLFAILVHGGILAVIAVLVLTTSCGQKAKPLELSPAELFFRDISDALDKAGAETVTVIQVNDSANAGTDLKRQVLEETQSQLHKLKGVGILEYPQSRLEGVFQQLNITPPDGISPEDAKALAAQLQTSALLYASIESKTPDVHFKIYSGETGAIIFANTLSGWQLPVTKPPEPLDLLGTTGGTSQPTGSTSPPSTADVGAAQSSGTVRGQPTGGR